MKIDMGEYELTNETSGSRYGFPVLATKFDGREYGPGDIISFPESDDKKIRKAIDDFFGSLTASQFVYDWGNEIFKERETRD